jgi:hypothetical protein
MISDEMARLSVASPICPRLIQALNASSRRSRRAENCRNGSIEERDRVMTNLPSRPWSAAARAAESRSASGNPSKSRSVSTRRQDCSSFSTFCENCVASVARRWLISATRVFCLAPSLAPARTSHL